MQAIVQVTERFPSWEHVNIQRGIDAYLAARHSGAEWFGVSGLGHRPREDIRSLLNMPAPGGLRPGPCCSPYSKPWTASARTRTSLSC